MTTYKIWKIGKVDNPVHHNSDFGESLPFHVGYYTKPPEVGERFNLMGISGRERGISTSPVTEIIDENTFKTLNSIYKFEKL